MLGDINARPAHVSLREASLRASLFFMVAFSAVSTHDAYISRWESFVLESVGLEHMVVLSLCQCACHET